MADICQTGVYLCMLFIIRTSYQRIIMERWHFVAIFAWAAHKQSSSTPFQEHQSDLQGGLVNDYVGNSIKELCRCSCLDTFVSEKNKKFGYILGPM